MTQTKFSVGVDELKDQLEGASHNSKPLLRALIGVMERLDFLIALSGGDAVVEREDGEAAELAKDAIVPPPQPDFPLNPDRRKLGNQG